MYYETIPDYYSAMCYVRVLLDKDTASAASKSEEHHIPAVHHQAQNIVDIDTEQSNSVQSVL